VLIVIVAVLARNRPSNRLGRVLVDYVSSSAIAFKLAKLIGLKSKLKSTFIVSR
jgi:hypothetical protein